MVNALVFVLLVGAATSFAYFILKSNSTNPEIENAKYFFATDLMSLPVTIALPLSFYAILRNRHSDLFVMDVIAMGIALILAYAWWRGTTRLSKCGVTNSSRRCLYLGIVLPAVILSSAIGIPFLILLTYSIRTLDPFWLDVWCISFPSLLLIALFCRMANQWIMTANQGSGPDNE